VSRFDQSPSVLDTAEIFRSVGDVAYEWHLDTDALHWSDNASVLLRIDMMEVASGRDFARYVEASDGTSRADVIRQRTRSDKGHGVPYQIQYALKCGDEKIWLEDTGRWFAGLDGKPLRAHGVVRAINKRHERELWLEKRANFDPLTG